LQDKLHDFARQPVLARLLSGDGGRALGVSLAGFLGAEDASLPRGVLGGPLLARAGAAGELRRHAELAEAQGVLDLEADLRGGHQVVVSGLGVGGGVLDQLVPQRALVGADGLFVARGQVDGEVVGGVGARDRDHLALVHLLGDALGDLDRVDLTPERPPKDALHERLHPLLYAS
jgi:hypothetical protein